MTAQARPRVERPASDAVRAQSAAWPLAVPWLAAFCLHRVAVIVFGFDGAYFWEEAYRLLVAEALLSGWDIPLQALQADPYAAGSLIMAIVATPAVALVGPSITVLKGVAVAWSAVGLLAWLALTARYFGRTAAHVLALAWVLAPPLFAVFNLVAMGSHAETVTLSGVQFLLAFAYVRDRRPSQLAAWGMLAALSCWFTYVSALTFVVAAGFALAAGALPVRRWPLLAGAFVVGLIPWIAHNVATGGSGLVIVERTFSPIRSAGEPAVQAYWYLASLSDLVKKGLPIALCFNDLVIPGLGAAVRGTWVAIAYMIGALACWAFCVARALAAVWEARDVRSIARHPELAVLALLPVLLLLIAASDHVFVAGAPVEFLTYRILVPAFPAVFLALALAVAAMPARARAAAVAALMLAGVISTVQLVRTGAASRAAVDADARRMGAEAFGHLLVYKHRTDFGTIEHRIGAIDDELRQRAYRGVGFSLAYLYRFDPEREVTALREDFGAIDDRFRSVALEGAHMALDTGMDQVRPLPPSPRTDDVRAVVRSLDPREVGP